MLNMGFIEDVEAILAESNDYRRILLFSATMPARIVALSKQYMKEVEVLKVPSKEMTTDLTDQIYFEVRDSDKFDALTRIIDVEADFLRNCLLPYEGGRGRAGDPSDATRLCGRRAARRCFAGTTGKDPEKIQGQAGDHSGGYRCGRTWN